MGCQFISWARMVVNWLRKKISLCWQTRHCKIIYLYLSPTYSKSKPPLLNKPNPRLSYKNHKMPSIKQSLILKPREKFMPLRKPRETKKTPSSTKLSPCSRIKSLHGVDDDFDFFFTKKVISERKQHLYFLDFRGRNHFFF